MHTYSTLDCDLSTGVCSLCGFKGEPHWRHNCPVKMKDAGLRCEAPAFGPGAELHTMLEQLGFKLGDCASGCKEWIDQMNFWGAAGSREHRQEIIDHLEKQKDAAALKDKIKAGALALAAGLPLSVEGLVTEAIERAGRKVK